MRAQLFELIFSRLADKSMDMSLLSLYRCLPDAKILEWYTGAGTLFVRSLHDGLCGTVPLTRRAIDALAGHLVSVQVFEGEYARRGYQPFALEEFALTGDALATRLWQRQSSSVPTVLIAAQFDLAAYIANYQHVTL